MRSWCGLSRWDLVWFAKLQFVPPSRARRVKGFALLQRDVGISVVSLGVAAGTGLAQG